MKTYTVSQTFTSIGDPAESTHRNLDRAECAAARLRHELTEMIAEWETPETRPQHQTGFTAELAAWSDAREIAGVDFDDRDERNSASPLVYGRAAAAYIASQAVKIETL